MRRLTARAALAGAGVVLGGMATIPALAADGVPTRTDLGTLGGCCSSAEAVNSLGQVAGTATRRDGTSHGVVWQDGREPVHLAKDFTPTGIDKQGDVTGHVIDEGIGLKRAAVVKGGKLTYLFQDRVHSVASDINDRGEVVGTRRANGEFAFRWHEGTMTVLPNLPGSKGLSWPKRINNKGEIIGEAVLPGGRNQAVIWRNGQVSALTSPDFGPVEQAIDINDQGDILVSVAGHVGVLRGNGGFTEIAWPESGYPIAMNNRGDVVGWKPGGDSHADGHALLWRGGKLIDLGLGYPRDINDEGRIAGNYFKKSDSLVDLAVVWG
jgi:probable HAF family extracellular repeat protein